jgi:cellulose synthase/poly-beta-1,6-N-acetylglucosamine synthase-like glycosyltransferase
MTRYERPGLAGSIRFPPPAALRPQRAWTRSIARPPPRLDPALDFLPRGVLDRATALRIMARAAAQNVGADEVAIAEGYVPAEVYYRALAARLGLPFLDGPFPVALKERGRESFRARIAPVEGIAGVSFALAPSGAGLAPLLRRGRGPEGAALTTPDILARSLLASGASVLAVTACDRLSDAEPALSARTAYGPFRPILFAAAALALAVLLLIDPAIGVLPASAWVGLLFLPSILLRLHLARPDPPVDPPRSPEDADLPRWSVIVALHREGRSVVADLLTALERLDYPRAKLELRFAVEEDDRETREALAGLRLPPHAAVILCPPGRPRTKPRALNIASAFCRGEFVTVFDAEDMPHPAQLRRAAAAFAAGSPDLACVQARLAIDNDGDGLLTRIYALDYAVLFDRTIAGLTREGWPVPLGGTSNHFRRSALDAALGWDAWNVTEDADLGLRLARMGFRVGSIASDTCEEAPRRLGPWFLQRCRWQKGWMQTALVHFRRPAAMVRAAGLRGAVVAAVLTLGASFSALFAPLTVPALFAAAAHVAGGGLPTAGQTVSFAVALFGIHSLVRPMREAAKRRGLRFSFREGLFLPVHLLLVSAAAWRALVELVFAPAHWHKTPHGTALRRRPLRDETAA